MFKRNCRETFGKEVAKLVFCVYFDKFNVARTNLFTEPVIFDGIMLGAGSHATRLEFAKCQGTNVVFVYADMEVGRLRNGNTTRSAKFLDEIEEREEIFAGLAERNVFCLHCG
jgi:hypothetical protein